MRVVAMVTREKETTSLLAHSVQDDFRALMNTEEEERSHALAKKTVFGEPQVRNVKRLRGVEWVFIIMATVTLLGLLGISIERLVSVHNSFNNFTDSSASDSGVTYLDSFQPIRVLGEYGWADSVAVGGDTTTSDCDVWICLNDFIFAILLLVNIGFSAVYCFDGILRERPFEMVGFAVGIFIIMVYVIVDYSLEGNQGDVYRLVRLVLVIVVGPQNIVLAFVVQYRMGYLVLNSIGSNQSLTRAYHSRSLLIIIQRFNVQILVNVLVLSWAKDGHFIALGEKVGVPILLVYMMVVSYVGWVAVVWELMPLSVAWFFLVTPSMGFYAYKIVNVAVHWKQYKKRYTEYYVNGNPPDVAYFVIDASSILVLCACGLLCVMSTCILMMISTRNFGKGLKTRLPPPCCKNRERELN